METNIMEGVVLPRNIFLLCVLVISLFASVYVSDVNAQSIPMWMQLNGPDQGSNLPIDRVLPEVRGAIQEFHTLGRISNIQLERAAGQLDAVERQIQRGTLNDDLAWVHYYRGYLLALTGNYVNAETHLWQAFSLHPKSSRISYLLGLVRLKKEEPIRQSNITLIMMSDGGVTQALFNQAIMLSKKEHVFVPKAYFYMGLYAYENGEVFVAKRYWEDFLDAVAVYERDQYYTYEWIRLSKDSYASMVHTILPLVSQIEQEVAATGR